MANRIGHIEINVSDMEKAKEFYGGLFGWTFTPVGDDYTIFHIEGGVGGGLNLNTKTAGDGAVRFYVEVEDMPDALKRINAAGGQTVMKKTKIEAGKEDYGYIGQFRDPFGTTLGLWSKK